MAFVNADDSRLTIGINQNQARHVRLGQDAEVTLKILPGKTLAANVIAALPLTPQGQLAPSGEIPLAPNPQTVAQPYGVLLELVDPGSIPSETIHIYPLLSASSCRQEQQGQGQGQSSRVRTVGIG